MFYVVYKIKFSILYKENMNIDFQCGLYNLSGISEIIMSCTKLMYKIKKV